VTRRSPVRLLTAAAIWSTLQFTVWLGAAGGALADPTDNSQATPQSDQVPNVAGMVVYKSAYPAAETVTRVQNQLNSIGKVAATVDFAQTAQWVNKTLRPTTVIIGGNPNAAAPIMAASQRAAIDLPQKYLVWQASGGTVFLGYNSADYVASCGGIDSSSGAVDALRSGSASVAKAASGNTDAVADGSGSCPGSYFVQKTSTASFSDTVSRYQAAFTKNNQPTVLNLDQAAAASSAGAQIPPTQLLLTDDASVSVPLVAAQQTMGIDLPLRFLVWQDDSGVHTGQPDIKALASRHGVSGQDTLLDTAAAANNYLTNNATGTGAGR
jgi:uncharacterized protein (DUF302 family)